MCRVPEKGHGRASDELSTEEVLAVVDELRALGVAEIGLVGAEPFMRRDLIQIVEAIVAGGTVCTVTTNGTLLTGDTIGTLLETNLHRLSVSIDAPSAVHDEIRGKEIFDPVTEAVASLVRAREARGRTDPLINVNCTLSTLNATVFSNLIPLCERLGADSLSVQYLSETTPEQVRESVLNGKVVASERYNPSGPSLRLQPGQLTSFQRELKALREYGGALAISHRAVTALSADALLEAGYPMKRCYWTKGHVIVDPYGDVYPCANIDGYVYGSVRQTSLTKIWHGEQAQAFRRQIGSKMLPVCKACCHFSSNWTPGQMAQFMVLGSI
jgi:radical SAM protein with 4Fe4S-binding SPASM domain